MKLFRPATSDSFRHNYGWTLAQTIVFWFVFLCLIPGLLFQLEMRLELATQLGPLPVPGIGLFIIGGAIGLTSGYIMTRLGHGTPLPTACPTTLVIRGPYAYVRNPMAVGGILQGIAVGIAIGSGLTIAYSIAGIPAWHFLARPSEERDMRDRFGDEFEHYRRHVRLWIPRLTPYQPQD